MIAAPAFAFVSVSCVIGKTPLRLCRLHPPAGPKPLRRGEGPAIYHLRKALLKRMDTRVKPAYGELAENRREPIRKFGVGLRAAICGFHNERARKALVAGRGFLPD